MSRFTPNREIRLCLAILCLCGGSLLAAQTFRTAVDLVQLDVSVLDKDRRPFLGLTAPDFTVFVDGKPRPIVAFDAVSVPPPPPPPAAAWIRDIAPDVVSNDRPAGRIVVIVIDDGSLGQASGDSGGGLWAVQKIREIARAAVDNLGPDDRTAVIYTESNRTAQDFTTDRARLLAAIDRAAIFPSPSPLQGGSTLTNDPIGIMRGSCACGLCSIETLEQVAFALRALPQQRKIVFYISTGVPVALEGMLQPQEGQQYMNNVLLCNLRKRDAMTRVFRQAQLSNITIQAVDPKGLLPGDMGPMDPDNPLAATGTQRLEFLKTVAETTGGRAVVSNNDMERQVPALFDETRSYYLLGVDSGVTADDGKLHRVEVRVNRPGVEVRTREGFYAPSAKERREIAALPTRSLEESIAGPLPKGDVPLDVAIAPFAEAGNTRRAALAVVLGVTQALDATRRRQGRTERIEVLSAAFHPETGKGQGERRQALDVAFKPTDSDTALFEVMSRLPVAPGRYQVRIGVRTADGKTGSVYTYAEVPDFGREPLSMSGLILSAAPAPKAAPPDAFSDLTPLLPTARREFHAADRVTAFVRAYRARSDAPANAPPLAIARVTDTSNLVLVEQALETDLEDWRNRSFADYQLPMRMAALPEGEYLLTVEVTAALHSARRAVRFRVKR